MANLMDANAETSLRETGPAATRRHKRIRWALLTLGVVVMLAFSGWGLSVLAKPERTAPADAFQFERIYVGTPEEPTSNQTIATIEAWFTNSAKERLKDVRIVVVGIAADRQVAVQRTERSLGDLKGRTTFDVPFEISVNVTRSYSVELLVLVEGLMVARGYGSFGFERYYDDDRFLLRVHSDFMYDYGPS